MLSVQTYQLLLTDEQKLSVPNVSSIVGAEILRDPDCVLLFVYGDHASEQQELTFYVVSTGQEMPDTFPGTHVRTLPKGDGTAYHVFIKPPPQAGSVQRGKPIVSTPVETPKGDAGDDTKASGGGNGV